MKDTMKMNSQKERTMKNNVTSFQVDHNKMERGLYVSRVDKKDNVTITTFDIRIKRPNKEMVLDTSVMHTLEHLLAVYLRDSEIKDDILYVGPMGCRTGMYILIFGEWSPIEFSKYLIEAFEYILDYSGVIPASTDAECGNYLDHNLVITKIESKKYIDEVLKELNDSNTIYP